MVSLPTLQWHIMSTIGIQTEVLGFCSQCPQHHQIEMHDVVYSTSVSPINLNIWSLRDTKIKQGQTARIVKVLLYILRCPILRCFEAAGMRLLYDYRKFISVSSQVCMMMDRGLPLEQVR